MDNLITAGETSMQYDIF